MKKLVFIAPHLSTGGMPQYLYKQIESIKNDMDVYCIEWDNVTGGVLVVQRNRIVNILKSKLFTLGEDKTELFRIIDKINPDIIHLQEIPELFMSGDIADRLYSTNRKYTLIETSHDSGYNVDNKIYLPDKFLMVSKFQTNLYEKLGVPCDVVEYPIENKIRTKTREQALQELGLDTNLKHVINVGLFTPRKNQAEVLEYARMLQNYPIQFHFLGNQADNFRFYWEPLMKEFPSNCKWWNERSDVDKFYEAADLFLFTSKGHATDQETMPLVIRESLSWKTPSMIYNLPVYMGYFDKYDTIEYLTDDLQKNAYRIAEKLILEYKSPHTITTPQTLPIVEKKEINKMNDESEIYIVSCFPNTKTKEKYLNDTVSKLKQINKKVLIASHYPVPQYIVEKADYYIYDAYNMIDTQNHTLDTDGPDFWVETDHFKMESIITYHASALSRIFGIALEFAESRGYQYFIVMESDSLYDVDDLKRLDTFKKKMVETNKDFLFFSPKFSEFAWQGERVYETYCYGGFLKPFLEQFRWPTTMEGWNALIKENKFNNCMEYLLKQKFKSVEGRALIKGTLKSEMLNSQIDLQTVGECSGIFYNENNPDQPILFLYNHDPLHRPTTYEMNIDVSRAKIELNCNCWSYQVLNFDNGSVTVRINTIRDGEIYSEYVKTISREDLPELRKFKRIRFK